MVHPELIHETALTSAGRALPWGIAPGSHSALSVLLGTLLLPLPVALSGCCDTPYEVSYAAVDALPDTLDAAPIVELAGKWASWGFEDPWTAQLQAGAQGDGGGRVVSGSVCSVAVAVDCMTMSAPLGGTIDGRRVTFEQLNPVGAAMVLPFSFAGWVSQDGTRLAGQMAVLDNNTFPVLWLKIPESAVHLEDDRGRHFRLTEDAGSWTGSLRLAHSSVDRADFNTLRYAFSINRFSVASDFGVFWHTERDLSAPQTIAVGDGRTAQAITIGPVPETAPDVATKLVVGIIDGQVVVVEVTMPSGGVYLFRP